MMLEHADNLSWSKVVRPLADASTALGQLAHGLQTSPLHPTWLWREITRVSVTIAQSNGYHAHVEQLRLALIGIPLQREDNTPGLSAARRVFLASAPLFRSVPQVDSPTAHWPRYWHDQPDDEAGEHLVGDRDQLMTLVRDLAAFADDGRRPALINLLIDLRKHAGARTLPAPLVRIALPLALLEAGLVPKAAPGLLAGRRLPLGFSRAVTSKKPLNDWLAEALNELAKEAGQSYRRLSELARQHRAWHGALAELGLRRHARAPMALDLLAATPVLSIGLVASHLGCSHAAAGKVVERLVDLGILIEQTSRPRHKVYTAGDLTADGHEDDVAGGGLAVSAPLQPVDIDGLNATLDGVFADLDRKAEQAAAAVAEAKG